MADLTLGTDVQTQLPVTLGQTERLQGLYVPGLQGTGKSTLLLNLICQDMEYVDSEGKPHGVCVIDPKGDLSQDVLARVPEHRTDDVIILDPIIYQRPFGLNLFECPYPEDRLFASQTQERVLHIFEKVWYPEGDMMSSAPQLTEVLSNLTYLLISNQEYTMTEIPRILTNQRFRSPLINRIHNTYVKDWWIQKYNMLSPTDQSDYVSSTMRRMERFLQNPILHPIVGQTKTSIDLRQVMDQGKILIVRLPVVRLGEDVVTLIGSVLISHILIAALSRENVPEYQRRFFALYCDEYHRFAIADFATLIAEGRGFGVATTVAHQWLEQLDRTNQAAVKSMVNKSVFRISSDNAHQLSGEFFHEPDKGEITGYKPVQAIIPNPVENLVQRNHPDPQLRNLIDSVLRPVFDAAEKEKRSRPEPRRIPPPTQEQSHLANIDRYLLLRMDPIHYDKQEEMVKLLIKIACRVLPLSEYYPLFDLEKFINLVIHNVPEDSHEFYDLTNQYRDRSLNSKIARNYNLWPDTYPHNFLAHEWKKPISEIGLSYFSSFEDNLSTVIENVPVSYFQHLKNGGWKGSYDTSSDTIDGPQVLQDELTKLFDELSKIELPVQLAKDILLPLVQIGDYLAEHPLMVNTASMEPVYERPRAYVDVQAEVASNLTHMRIRQARVRLTEDGEPKEYTIATAPPPPIPDGVEAKLKHIAENSRAYTRPLEEVESEIAKRQTPPDIGPLPRSG